MKEWDIFLEGYFFNDLLVIHVCKVLNYSWSRSCMVPFKKEDLAKIFSVPLHIFIVPYPTVWFGYCNKNSPLSHLLSDHIPISLNLTSSLTCKHCGKIKVSVGKYCKLWEIIGEGGKIMVSVGK